MRPSSHASVPIVANMHVQPAHEEGLALRELASGGDALYLSGHGYLSRGFLAQLEEERMFADRVSVPVPFELGPLTFGLAPHGWGKYRYCLDHETGRIGFTSSRRLPSVRIQPRAESLHSVGPQETVRHFADLVRPFIEGLVLSVARLDLFVDMEGMQLCAQDRSAFVCRGDGCTTYENANTVTGFAFGSRRTQRISARLYDKTAEMALKSTDWWELVWGDRHTPGAQVWRIEFEVGRAALSDLDLFLPVPCSAPSRRSGPIAPGSGSPCALRVQTRTVLVGRSTSVGKLCSRRHSRTELPNCASSGSASGPRSFATSCPLSSGISSPSPW